ncbi:MAG TPA: TlpA disulfide reductase family protein [Parafilimonas sp.]|nr:TlpA disulfide reductase family protein [Parafilimonas sp.]
MCGFLKQFLIVTCFTCFTFSVNAQKILLIKINQLENRIHAGKDTTYILNFWATWCAPCIEELPNFEKLNNEYKKEKLKILLVSVDFKSQLTSSVIPFVSKKKLKNEVFFLDETDQQEYINRIDSTWSGAIPASLFIKDNKRKFIEKQLSYPELLREYQTL